MEKSKVMEIKTINFKNKIIQLKLEEYTGEIDVEDLTQIHYFNLLGDILTFPSALNRIGNLLTEADANIKEYELDLKSAKVELRKRRALLEKEAWKNLKQQGINSPTLQQISNELLLDTTHDKYEEEYREDERGLIEVQRDRDHINNLYWSCKAKLDLLTRLSEKIRPEDFADEVLDSTINGILIRSVHPLIK